MKTTPTLRDDANRLEEIHDELEELLDEAKRIVARRFTGGMRERYERGCLAQIEASLSHNHHWLGKALSTVEEMVQALVDLANDRVTEEDE